MQTVILTERYPNRRLPTFWNHISRPWDRSNWIVWIRKYPIRIKWQEEAESQNRQNQTCFFFYSFFSSHSCLIYRSIGDDGCCLSLRLVGSTEITSMLNSLIPACSPGDIIIKFLDSQETRENGHLAQASFHDILPSPPVPRMSWISFLLVQRLLSLLHYYYYY